MVLYRRRVTCFTKLAGNCYHLVIDSLRMLLLWLTVVVATVVDVAAADAIIVAMHAELRCMQLLPCMQNSLLFAKIVHAYRNTAPINCI